MDAKEIIHCVLQIEKSNADSSYGNILTLLCDLDKLQVTAEQLETTDIVKVLYRLLRTCSDNSVKKTAKSLLSKWKRQYSKGVKCEKDNPGLSRRVSPPSPGEAGDYHGGPAPTCDSAAQSVTCAELEASSVVAKDGLRSDPCTAESTSASCISSSVRSKCDQLLLAALCPELPDQGKAAALAQDIEEHIHELHKSSQVKYKACVRSKVANLKNPKNGHLGQGLLSGSLSPEAFARMSSEEMASVELRQLREEYSSRGVSERQLPQGIEGTQTQKIRCRRCGGSDCRVTQVSRGALFLPAWVRQSGPDEDAMTFVTCSRCGQQWYHSGWVCL
ncbi:transcription elongation factor A N-terminal and central domain-containing protein [Pempheris klunzingeri]|uniref:transcription elongation factor A N-terminal and central domain-containing protein n=1 Tax=Pempheris klunzingeri TaxID=3127111 RepID=UPI0039806AFF